MGHLVIELVVVGLTIVVGLAAIELLAAAWVVWTCDPMKWDRGRKKLKDDMDLHDRDISFKIKDLSQ